MCVCNEDSASMWVYSSPAFRVYHPRTCMSAGASTCLSVCVSVLHECTCAAVFSLNGVIDSSH